MWEFLDRLKREWSTVWTARWSFVTVLVIAIFVTVLIMRVLDESTVSGKDATIQALDTALQSYKDRLNGATPDEAKQRID
ncbi:MAG: hypothetical protein WDN29_06245 [Methylovirgula sp.]